MSIQTRIARLERETRQAKEYRCFVEMSGTITDGWPGKVFSREELEKFNADERYNVMHFQIVIHEPA